MATLYSPKIVTDGLVLALDAANPKSYPGSGTTWFDLSGNGNNTTINNSPLISNGIVDLDGTNDYIEIPYSSYWDNNVFGTAINFTIMCWAKCDNFYNWTSIIHKDNGGFYSETEGAALWVNSSGYQAVFGHGEPNNPTGWGFNLTYSTSNTVDWFHLAFSGDGTTGRFYVNGSLHNSALLSLRSLPVTTTTNPVRFGVRGGSAYYNGKIALPLLYTKGLNASEILQNFNATKGRFGL